MSARRYVPDPPRANPPYVKGETLYVKTHGTRRAFVVDSESGPGFRGDTHWMVKVRFEDQPNWISHFMWGQLSREPFPES